MNQCPFSNFLLPPFLSPNPNSGLEIRKIELKWWGIREKRGRDLRKKFRKFQKIFLIWDNSWILLMITKAIQKELLFFTEKIKRYVTLNVGGTVRSKCNAHKRE